MPVPVVNLRPCLEAARASSEANLAQMFARSHFILGEQVRTFEQELASAFQTKFTVGVGNGTDAISISLRESGLLPGAHVLTTPLTAPFTAVGIRNAGGVPVFADIDPRTLQIDPVDAEDRIGRKVKALVAVHLYGNPCSIDRLAKTARKYKLILLQDACQAHGATVNGKPLADFSRHVAYSFYPTKNLGCLGDGGAIATRSVAVAQRLTQMRDGGRRGGQVSYGEGVNSRLDELQACYLRAFLPFLAEWNNDRRRTAAYYDEALKNVDGVTLVERSADSVCHLYVVRARRRDRLREFLTKRGVGTGIHYPVPLHLHPAFASAKLKRGDLPHAEKACREIISLPVWPYLPLSSAEEVVQRIAEFYGGPASR